MKIGIVIPVVLDNAPLLELTFEAVSSVRARLTARLYVICNGLSVCSPRQLQTELRTRFSGVVRVVHKGGARRGVADSWNLGCAMAQSDNADYIALVGNDTRLRNDCLDRLIEFAERGESDLCSGCSYNRGPQLSRNAIVDGMRFSCALLTPRALAIHGLFDANFWPAYFEDNDYYARIVLGGGKCRIVGAARFFHHGSMTVRHDQKAAAQVRERFAKNRQYFARKWGVPRPEQQTEGVLKRYYPHPFNDPSKPLSWFPTSGDPDRMNAPQPASIA